ncbi:hydroxyethylthiazole kinase [Solicola gregarius]|uniref:Hydroxyethylthiazole kinase n=1 Tax=Solicola gregarius TaxID=2908642 RepID=A0AA46TIK4_9ACTN|nr:hydroxyethylthiazole kinase [Solicola gregarius]UYM05808.1 hydroxyethylthiazole kinase [Solicola gregarius]
MSHITPAVIAVHAAVREQAPLVQCITNYVSMDLAANVLNAAGASPAMVHDPREAGEFAALAGAVVANIGTLSPRWVDGMLDSVEVARDANKPWVLDPVAVGATSYRRESVDRLLELDPTVIRGNASEVLTIATRTAGGKGVDSDASLDDVREHADALAKRTGSIVAVTGPEDYVTDGEREPIALRGGDPRMPLITALGCSLSALVGACVAAHDDAFEATTAALAMLSAAGEIAGASAEGPGSLRWRLLDELARLDAGGLAQHVGR